jgi:hypothetical protein
MAASITFYNSFKEYVADGTFDLNTDTFKVILVSSSYTFSAAHTVLADITNELSTANGYTNGGATLGSVTFSQTSGTATFDAADTTWTASGGSIVARRAVIHKSGTANSRANPLVASVLLDTTPADVTTTTGNTLTLQWNASGIFTLA